MLLLAGWRCIAATFSAAGQAICRFFQQVAPGGPETLAIQDFAMQVMAMTP